MRKILVIDDEKRIRKIYSRLLMQEGLAVIETSNAADANEILKREDIELILLDIKMPGTDGSITYDAIQLLYKKIKVIVSSVYPLDEQKRIIKGAYDYYDKSQGIDILLMKIRSALNNGNATDERI